MEHGRARGFGMQLIDTIADEYGEDTFLDFHRDGVRCEITIPLDPRIVHFFV